VSLTETTTCKSEANSCIRRELYRGYFNIFAYCPSHPVIGTILRWPMGRREMPKPRNYSDIRNGLFECDTRPYDRLFTYSGRRFPKAVWRRKINDAIFHWDIFQFRSATPACTPWLLARESAPDGEISSVSSCHLACRYTGYINRSSLPGGQPSKASGD
jgi:hypothetical protein